MYKNMEKREKFFSNELNLDPKIWGPSYWFFLDNIAFNYPANPNDVIKKKYYEVIQNFPIFIPNNKISNEFQNLLNLYPVKPYLDNKQSLIRWVNFIHNKVNIKLEKPQMDIKDFYIKFYNQYNEKPVRAFKNVIKYVSYLTIITILIFMALFYYNK